MTNYSELAPNDVATLSFDILLGGMLMLKLITVEGLSHVAESLDQLMNIDISARGTIKVLFDAGRELLNGKPMTQAAVDLLEQSVKPGD